MITDTKPRLFIGSSGEQKDIAIAVQANLEAVAECSCWNQGVFDLGGTAIQSLLYHLKTSDFAVFVCSPDDMTSLI
jgi:predicted nucleotide-binding protein